MAINTSIATILPSDLWANITANGAPGDTTKGVYVVAAGNIVWVDRNGVDVTTAAPTAGVILPIVANTFQVGTTATIQGIY